MGVPFVHKHTQFSLILNLNELLAAIGRLYRWSVAFVVYRGRHRRTKEMFYSFKQHVSRNSLDGARWQHCSIAQISRLDRLGRLTNFILTWEWSQEMSTRMELWEMN
jgi:hypothetical protein